MQDVLSQFSCDQLWKDVSTDCKKQKYTIIENRFNNLIFNPSTQDEVTHSNIGEELWKTPILDQDIIFDRFLKNNKRGHFYHANTEKKEEKKLFFQPITVQASTQEVKQKVSREIFEEQLIPLCKDIFALIEDIQSKEEHEELQQVLLNEFNKYFSHILDILESNVKNSESLHCSGSASLIDKHLYIARLTQGLRKLYVDLFYEIYARLNLYNDKEESFATCLRKIKTQLANLKQKQKKQTKEDTTAGAPFLIKFTEMENRFNACYLSAFEEWISKQSDMFTRQIKEDLESQQWNQNRKEMWQSVASSDREGESLSLPFKTSYNIFNALHQLNIAIYSIGDYNIEKNVIDKLSDTIAEKVFKTYSEWINTKLEQGKQIKQTKLDELEKKLTELNACEEKSEEVTKQISETEKLIETQKDLSIPVEELINEEGFLQILFDVRYLGSVFLGAQQTYEKLSIKQQSSDNTTDSNEVSFVKLVSLILEHIDPINWETYEKSFNTLVSQSVNRNVLLIPNLCKSGLMTASIMPKEFGNESPLSPLSTASVFGEESSSNTNAFLKLCKPDSMTINLLPIPKRENKLRHVSHMGESTSYSFDQGEPYQHESDGTSHPQEPNALGQSTVFGSFVGSLQNLIQQSKEQPQPVAEPQKGFAFTGWF